jgi:hypothetical protein
MGQPLYFSDHGYGATVGVDLPICMVVSARPEGRCILTVMGQKVQDAAQNTSPVLPERRIIFGTSCSMIEAALEREANLPPKLRRHAQFERVDCLASSAPMVVGVARGVREGESKRSEILMHLASGLCGRNQPPVASESLNLTSLADWQGGSPNGRPANPIA